LWSGRLSASELTKHSQVPSGRIYDILRSLSQKGFCEIILGAVKKYKAVNPKVAISGLLEEQKRKQELLKEVAERLEERYANIEEVTSPVDFINVLTSKASMIAHFNELVRSAKSTVRSFNKPPYAVVRSPETIPQVAKAETDMLSEGLVTSKAIYEIEGQNFDTFIRWMAHFFKAGEEIRVIDHLPMKLVIMDTAKVLILLRGTIDKNNLTSLAIEQSNLTEGLIALHETYWEKAMTLEAFLKSRNLDLTQFT